MPRISVDAVYLRNISYTWQRFQQITVEMRQTIEFGILGVVEYRPYLGSLEYELQATLRRLYEEEALIGQQVRELLGWAGQVESVYGGGYSVPPTFFNPISTYTNTYPGSIAVSVTRSQGWWSDPISVRWLGSYLYGGRTSTISLRPFDWNFSTRDWVNNLANQGTYVNMA